MIWIILLRMNLCRLIYDNFPLFQYLLSIWNWFSQFEGRQYILLFLISNTFLLNETNVITKTWIATWLVTLYELLETWTPNLVKKLESDWKIMKFYEKMEKETSMISGDVLHLFLFFRGNFSLPIPQSIGFIGKP